MSTETKEIFIPIGTFDAKRLSLGNPIKSSFEKNGDPIEFITSPAYYKDDDGDLCIPYVELPPSYSYGVNVNYKMSMPKEEEFVDSLQISYSLTSRDTVDSPTEDEQYAIDVFTAIHSAVWNNMKKECDADNDIIPDPSHSAYLSAKKKKNPSYAVKPIFSHPNLKDAQGNTIKGKPDVTKPMKAYIKLVTKGKGRDLKAVTRIMGPGDKRVSARQYCDTPCTVHPVIRLDGAYWGAHGKNSHGVSARIRVYEMNITPKEAAGTTRRMIGPNTASPIEDESDNDEDAGFAHPGGEDEGFSGEDAGDATEALMGGSDSDEDESDKPAPKKKKKVVPKKKDSEDSDESDKPAPKKKVVPKKKPIPKKKKVVPKKEASDESDSDDESSS